MPDVSEANVEQVPMRPMRVLYFVEGYTDIRFVVGLSEICDLKMVVPAKQYQSSGLKQRVADAKLKFPVDEIPGGRLGFQARSLRYLWNEAPNHDVILAQEVLRGAANANLVGVIRRVPVITYMGIAPVEYFRCRRERRQIGLFKAWAGEAVIRLLMTFNGMLAKQCLAMGPYLRNIAAKYCANSDVGLYYGVDTRLFRPADAAERVALRSKCNLPQGKFLIILSSRISHEKDPETVLRATDMARQRGLDAVLINLGDGYQDFLDLADRLQLKSAKEWVLGLPAAHPMIGLADYFRAADAMALASLAEGAAYSTLESLACGTPLVATAVGGMAVQLKGYARLTPRKDPSAMAEEFLWIAANSGEAKAQALRGRDHVIEHWDRSLAFSKLKESLESVNA